MLNPGDKAPDFTGRDHNGNTVKLSDFKGKTVVLWFYPKATPRAEPRRVAGSATSRPSTTGRTR